MSHERILFACKIEDGDARRKIQALGELVEMPGLDSPEELLRHGKGAGAIIVPFTKQSLITRDVLDAIPTLRLVGTTYGGVRQNIDDLYAIEKGLCVVHTGPTRIRPMAEYTLALILASLTQVANYHHYMRSGEAWPREKFGRTRILFNRKVGIVGFGLIGQGIAQLLRSFTDKIHVYSEHASPESLQEQGFQKASLPEMFSQCEIIILAGGYTPKTHHLIRKAHFDAMADEALFVNIARGKMVHQEEMIAALHERNIFLALDVFENEPLEPDSPLRQNDRVLLAPHRANAPREFEQRWQFIADELERFYHGQTPQTALALQRAQTMSES
jgi:D-3-phosphoglycerate dehydrogenase